MFAGIIEAMSHEGGLLLSFGGSSPALDSIIVKASDGVYIGKIDGVLGNTENPVAHVGHIDRQLNLESLIGQEVTIRAKKPREDRRVNSREGGNYRNERNEFKKRDNSSFDRNSNFRNRDDGGRRNNRGRRDGGSRNFDRGASRDYGNNRQRDGRRNSGKIFSDNDWDCHKCGNSNFSFRTECNRCGEPRPGVGRRDSRNRQDNRNRDHGRDGGRGRRDDGRRERGRDRGRGRRDNERRDFDRRDRNRRDGDRRFSERNDSNSNTERPKPKQNNFRKARGKRPGHAHNNAPKPIVPRKFRRNRDD